MASSLASQSRLARAGSEAAAVMPTSRGRPHCSKGPAGPTNEPPGSPGCVPAISSGHAPCRADWATTLLSTDIVRDPTVAPPMAGPACCSPVAL